MRRAALIACAVLLCASPALAQEGKQTLQSRVTDKIVNTEHDKYFTLNVENDMLGGGTDRNYTSGVRLTYFNREAEIPYIFDKITSVVPTFTINETTAIYYTLGQNLFTPKDITASIHNPADRPWAAFLYASAGLNTITKNHVDDLEATVGVIGPAALGRPAQSFIHKYISHSPTPRGWGTQLKNEPALMLSWERSWPSQPYSRTAFGWTGEAVPHIGATVGNIYDYASGGVSLHLSPYQGRWQDDPIRVRPSMPGTGAFIVPEHTFSWYLFGGVEGRAVARNIFLDGNTFADSYRIDKKPFVMDATAGIAFTYGTVRVSYAMIYRTKEFVGQDGASAFGTMSLGYRF
jgi:lipid A 3-O-deacylase